ncbi:serine hydrolase domain-containing protein [Paenibacillus apiarius]|uniref:serine hydrolase domain-containing protein n=1 Tax=Paenibacillus apiarius TaxID=46240 RepID=UPI003B3B791F
MRTSRKYPRRYTLITACMILLVCVLAANGMAAYAQAGDRAGTIGNGQTLEQKIHRIEEYVEAERIRSQIPGLSLVIVEKGRTVLQKGFGYADLDAETPVTGNTLFEIGSTTKAFTGLAILQLEKDGLVKRTDDVKKYIPWLELVYNGKPATITLNDLLYHTSGIPAGSIGYIPASDAGNALELTVRALLSQQLNREPGRAFEYATINYDVLGLVIENVTKQSFEAYMKQQILEPIGMKDSFAGLQHNPPSEMATGYRLGFMKPRAYTPPVYRGNTPAGYIISSANDIAKWMNTQLGYGTFDKKLIQDSHVPDQSVAPLGDNNYYASGWIVAGQDGNVILHAGANPTFSSFIRMQRNDQLGVAVMANMMSDAAAAITQGAMELWKGADVGAPYQIDRMQRLDKAASAIILIAGGLIALFLFLTGRVIRKLARQQRSWTALLGRRLIGFALLLIMSAAGIVMVLTLPRILLGGMPWAFIAVWSPPTIMLAIYSLISVFISLFGYGTMLSLTAKTR